MNRDNGIKLHRHETFNALRNKTAMKRWGQEEICHWGSPEGRTPLFFAVISFSAQAQCWLDREKGKSQEQLTQMW